MYVGGDARTAGVAGEELDRRRQLVVGKRRVRVSQSQPWGIRRNVEDLLRCRGADTDIACFVNEQRSVGNATAEARLVTWCRYRHGYSSHPHAMCSYQPSGQQATEQ